MTYSPASAFSLAANTIIVANGSVNQSILDALSYCSSRGVPTANIRIFNFGTTPGAVQAAGLNSTSSAFYASGSLTVSCDNGNSKYNTGGSDPQPFYNSAIQGKSVYQTIHDDIVTGGALCILLSTYTPSQVQAASSAPTTVTSGAGSDYHPLSAVLGAAAVLNGTSTYLAGTTISANPNTAVPAASITALTNDTIPTNWASLTNLRPHGRLGCPDLTNTTTFAEIALRAGGSTTVLSNAVTNALAYEAVNNLAQPIWTSSTENSYIGVPPSAAYAAYVADAGFSNVRDMGDQGTSGTFAYNFQNTELTGTPPSLWAALLLEGHNEGPDGGAQTGNYYYSTLYANLNYTLQAGAFGGCWYSYSYNFGMGLMWNGASAAIMTVGEPLANTIGFGHEIFHFLYAQGVPLALANFWSPTVVSSTNDSSGSAVLGASVFGDPLYQPFKAYNGITADVTIDTTSITIDSILVNVSSNTTLASTPVVTTQPSSISVNYGSTATFTAAASGATSEQWQVSTDGGSTWTSVSGGTGGTTNSYTTATLTSASNNYQYRCAYTNISGTAYTVAALLTVIPLSAPSISNQPINASTGDGGTALFAAFATGNPTPTIQWQVSTNSGSTWSNVSLGTGGTTNSYTTNVLALTDSGTEYRAVFTNSQGTATTSPATVTVLSVLYTGGRGMQFAFGPGNLIATPLTNVLGTAVTNKNPRKLGGFQEATFESSADIKTLYGPNGFPLAAARGKGKVSLKVKAANISIDAWNSLFAGQDSTTGTGQALATNASSYNAYIDNAGQQLSSTSYTPAVATLFGTGAAYAYDLGVVDGNGRQFVNIGTGTPLTGQYTVASGVYTFAAADEYSTLGVPVYVSYAYTNATASTMQSLTVYNQPMGASPFLQLDFSCQYGGNPFLLTLFYAICAKTGFATKLDDFTIPDWEFEGFSDPSNRVYRISGAQQ